MVFRKAGERDDEDDDDGDVEASAVGPKEVEVEVLQEAAPAVEAGILIVDEE